MFKIYNPETSDFPGLNAVTYTAPPSIRKKTKIITLQSHEV